MHTIENKLPLSKDALKLLSNLSLAAGFLSIVLSMLCPFDGQLV
jgi:hypothetical protein